jgi:hypothetical protein
VSARKDAAVERQPTRLVDADGNVIAAPDRAAAGEVLEHDERGEVKRRTWFLIEEVEFKWLPVSESAFLLWVLALLVVIWVAVAAALRFF